MAEERPVTPEKQLLNIIEKPTSQSSLRTATIKYQSLSLFSLSAIKGRFAFLKNRFIKRGGLRQPDIKTLNSILKFCVFVLLFYFIVNLSLSIVRLRKDITFRKIKIEKIEEEKPFQQIVSPLKAVSYYLEKARERDIFTIGIKKEIPETGIFAKGPSQAILEATQHLKLVGVSWSADPDVMIEDTKTQRTFFLKKSQTIDNEIKVQAIFRDKVVLSFRGEEIELR